MNGANYGRYSDIAETTSLCYAKEQPSYGRYSDIVETTSQQAKGDTV